MLRTMRRKSVVTMLFLCSIITLVGCGDTETDVTPLPQGADIRFNVLPLEPGSLIPPEEIPVLTVEIVREDDESAWWQLIANPMPIHEDLVVLIEKNERSSLLVIPKNQNTSKEFQEPKRGFSWVWIEDGEYHADYALYDFALDFSYFHENNTLWVGWHVLDDDNTDYWIRNRDLEYIPLRSGQKREGDYDGQSIWAFPNDDVQPGAVYTWFPSKSSRIRITDVESLVYYISSRKPFPFLTDDGYAIQADFQFSYYHVGTPSEITILPANVDKPQQPPE